MPAPIVLVVEDHPDTREMYAEALADLGVSIVEAPSAAHGFQRAVTIRPNVILTDLRLGPGPEGLELCERLKQDPQTRDMPVIIVTGSIPHPRIKRRADAVGCAVVLMKPVDPFAIAAQVLRLLGSSTVDAPRPS